MEGMFCSGVWFFAATVPGYFPVTELIINSVYSSIQEANVKPSTYQLKVGSNWVMQSDKQQNGWQRKKKNIKALQWPSYSPDLQIQTV